MLMFGRKRMVAELAGSPAGAGGPGAAPPAAPAGGVSGPAAPAGDRNPFPRTFGAPPAPAPGDAGGGDDELDAAIREDAAGHGIPHDRVRNMRKSWETRAEQRAREATRQEFVRDFGPVLEELQALREKASAFDPAAVKQGVAESFLRALGVEEKKPEPKFITEEQYRQGLEETKQTFHREAQHRADLERASLDLQAAKVKHADVFQHFPVLEELAAAVWSTPYAIKNRIPFSQVVEGLVAQVKDGIGKYNQAYVADKAAGAREAPIVPGSGTTPGKKPPAKVDNSPEGTAKRAIEFLENPP